MRAVAYARVSSAAQRERDTIESQMRALPAFVAAQGWQLVRSIETYVDDGRTARAGHLEQRRGLAALLRDAAAGVFDVVVVVDLDRLTRSEDLTERGAILGAFQRAGVRVASASTGQILDLSTSSGDLFATIGAFWAAEENRKRSERARRGKLLAAQRGGKSTGRDPFGLHFEKPNRWTLDPTRAPIAREIVERIAAGETCYALADELRDRGAPAPGRSWHRGRVYDLVRSRHVVGEYLAHEASHTIVAVPPIVDEDTWQRAQDVLEQNRKAPLRKTTHVYLLEGLARCGVCGGRMLVQSGCLVRGRRWRPAVYLCENRKNRRVGDGRCTASKVRVDDIDARVWARITCEIDDPGLPDELAAERRTLAADARDWEADAADWQSKLTRLDQVEASTLAAFRRGLVSEAARDAELVAIRRERAALRAQLRTAEGAAGQRKSARARAEDALAAIGTLRAAVAVAAAADRRSILRLLVDPGGIVFDGTDARVTLFVPRATFEHSTGSKGALVAGSRSSVDHESFLRIRLVA